MSSPGGLVWFDEPPPPRATEQLSRDKVVAAAMAVADSDVRGEVTMRAIATRLGVRSPMALYRYVGSKDGLVDLMVDEVYGEIRVPAAAGWRESLRGLGLSAWEAVQRHPWFARLAFTRPPLGPHALAIYDAALAALAGLPLSAPARMGFVSTVLGQALASGLAVLEERAMRERVGLHTEEQLAAAARPYLERITAEGRYPHFIEWANDPGRVEEPPPPSRRCWAGSSTGWRRSWAPAPARSAGPVIRDHVRSTGCRARILIRPIGGEPLPEHPLGLLGALAALGLRPAEELGEVVVAVALRVLDVGLQAERVAEAGLGEPDQVVVLVLGSDHVAGLGGRHLRSLLSGTCRTLGDVPARVTRHTGGPAPDRPLGACRMPGLWLRSAHVDG